MAAEQDPTAAQLAAFTWFARLTDPNANARTRREFEQWRNADPEHERLFEDIASTRPELEELWRKLRSTRRRIAFPQGTSRAVKSVRNTGVVRGVHGAGDIANAANAPRANRDMASPNRLRAFGARPALLGLAAALLVVIFAAGALRFLPSQTHPVAYSSAVGEVRTIVLADGSSIELDAASRIEIAYSDSERRVTLRSGRALFDVAHDQARPFVVATDLGAVHVLGTAFVVEIMPSGVRASVIRGRVSAERTLGWGGSILALLPGADTHVQIAGPGQEVSFLGDDRAAALRELAHPSDRLAWREGLLVFERAELGDACAEVTRHTGFVFAFAEPSLAQTKITASFDANNAERFLANLTQTGVIAEPMGANRYYLRRAADRRETPRQAPVGG